MWLSDRQPAQMKHAEEHQFCLAHLIRNAQYAIDHGDTVFAPDFKALLQDACAVGRRRPDLADATIAAHRRRLERALDRLLARKPTDAEGRKLRDAVLCADVRFGVTGDWNIGMNEVAIGLAVPEFAIALARHRLTPPGVARASTGLMFKPEEAARFGYLDYVVRAENLDAAVGVELQRLQTLDMKSYELTKARLNGPLLAAIAAASPNL